MATRSQPLLLRTLDGHTAGEPLRLVLEGWPEPEGRTILERRAWAKQHQDHLRRALMFEPRGHADMYGALLTPPERADSDTGVLFMHNEGFSTMCGHGIIAVVTMAIERGLLRAGDVDALSRPDAETRPMRIGGGRTMALNIDAPAGQIRARADVEPRGDGHRVSRVSFVNVPSFVLAAAVPVVAGGRSLRVDVAFGGAFYAIVDAESAGLAVVPSRLTELRQRGMEIKHAVEAAIKVVHPEEPGLAGIYGTIFTGPAQSGGDLRNVTIFAEAEVDRSPCGTGTCAVLAVLDAMGLVDPSRPFVHESIIGTSFTARVAGRARIGDRDAIVPELSGEAWITGEHRFLIDPDDPLRRGFRI